MPPKRISELREVPILATRPRSGVALQFGTSPAAQGGTEQKRFHMVAHTGKRLDMGYWGSWVFDLSGIEFKQQVPALLDHTSQQRVGFTDKIEVGAEGLVADGLMLSNEFAQEVLRDAGEGFPWQASVQLDLVNVQVLDVGQSADVNGRTEEGPVYIVRQSTLREVTFCALGADDDTSAIAASKGNGPKANFYREEQMPPKIDDNPSAMTVAQLQKQHPELVAELCASAATAARDAERERAAAILSACDDTQLQLGIAMLKDGTSSADATVKLNADLRQRLAAAKSASLGGQQTGISLSGGNAGGNDANDPGGKLRASFPADERGEKAYQAFLARHKGQGVTV